MKFVADLHLHSKYSRAVSQDMILVKMAEWAKFKGIHVLATGDFTHPFWFEQLKSELTDAGNGLYKLKSTVDSSQFTEKSREPSTVNREPIYFLLSCEVSSIYSQGGKTRRIHNLFFFPTLSAVEKFNQELLKRGANLRSDGRPIVGISARDLVEIALSVSEKALIIPAHAWTPWFSVFGAFSGFDSIEECFGDLAFYIYGIETGLSSDPAMNWRIDELDERAILSSSDAHSLEKMGREATVFETDEISYDAIYKAIAGPVVLSARGPAARHPQPTSSLRTNLDIKSKSSSDAAGARRGSPTRVTPRLSNYPKIAFTIEFYPEEGKYHFTGHRDCNVSLSPEETKKKGDICPVCGRQLTIGVMHRVEELANRNSKFEIRNSNGVRWIYPEGNARPPYVSLVPLGEILAEALEVGAGSKKLMDQYFALVNNLGSEFNVLLKTELDDLEKYAPAKVIEGIAKVRRGEIVVEPGYDGKFGTVKILRDEEVDTKDEKAQLNLFA